MGRELQKKKARSGRQPIRQLNRTKKILNPRGNDAIAKNWYATHYSEDSEPATEEETC
jgi:hypothetical protein